MSIANLRASYHRSLCACLMAADGVCSSLADAGSQLSSVIACGIAEQLGCSPTLTICADQMPKHLFEGLTKTYLEDCFKLLHHVRPGAWVFLAADSVEHKENQLVDLQLLLTELAELETTLPGYLLIAPSILVARRPLTDTELNRDAIVVDEAETVSRLSPLRASNRPNSPWILHASISCKWTIRSDRAQNIRTEGINLIRHRKGHTPHIAAVTAEPLPTRLASLALGTGELDCVYHFALPELQAATRAAGGKEQLDMLDAMVDGRRLRDISDLPLDLAV